MKQLLEQSYWPADTSSPILETTVGSVLRQAAASWPDALAMVAGVPEETERPSWTFRELLADAERAAHVLAGRFEPGEHIAVWAPNIPEWVVLEFGAALAGLTLVTVNPALRPAELAYVLGQSGAAGIFMVREYRSPMESYLREVRDQLPELRDVVMFSEWDEFLESGPVADELPTVSPDDIAQIQYTSGTTGFPKGAMLRHRGMTNNARLFVEHVGLQPGEAYLNLLPLFHTSSCGMAVLGTAQAGATHVPVFAFDPTLVLELAETHRAGVFIGVPTMLIALLEHPDLEHRDLSSLRCVLSGGAPVPGELVRRVEDRLKVTMAVMFGTTECCPAISQVDLDDNEADRTTTMGRPFPQTEVRISDPATNEVLPTGAEGELCTRGYLVMAGYHQAPEATAKAIDSEGWYHTSDLASMDERGYLRFEGRISDMIIRGGENIYPSEIEGVLFSHPQVAEAAVVGMPDPKWGEIVVAFIRPEAGASPSESELRSLCRDKLAAYKTPPRWVFVESFPLTPSGKVQKFKLVESLDEEPVAEG